MEFPPVGPLSVRWVWRLSRLSLQSPPTPGRRPLSPHTRNLLRANRQHNNTTRRRFSGAIRRSSIAHGPPPRWGLQPLQARRAQPLGAKLPGVGSPRPRPRACSSSRAAETLVAGSSPRCLRGANPTLDAHRAPRQPVRRAPQGKAAGDASAAVGLLVAAATAAPRRWGPRARRRWTWSALAARSLWQCLDARSCLGACLCLYLRARRRLAAGGAAWWRREIWWMPRGAIR